MNVLDYDPDESTLSEEFDDYFDLSEDEGSVHYSIEHARDSSQEDRFSNISTRTVERLSESSQIESLSLRLSNILTETNAQFSSVSESQASSEEAVPRRRHRTEPQRHEWQTLEVFDNDIEFDAWFSTLKDDWIK
uniref:Uncharacterized protein n=1 Tax=Acrobeloides nanus TaxID=290746 RepID=A0A914CR04_9BILA